jgi:hypothetical protein
MLDRPQRVTNEAPQRAAPASAIEIFRERCEARAVLVANGVMPLIEAVDGLQKSAAAQGLLKQYGQDEIQRILAESFGRWRVE